MARDLLADSGSIFVQIGDANVHLIRSILDEVFGATNFVSLITVQKMAGLSAEFLNGAADYLLLYAKDRKTMKYRQLFRDKILGVGHGSGARYDQLLSPTGEKRSVPKNTAELDELLAAGWKSFRHTTLTTFGSGGSSFFQFDAVGKAYWPSAGKGWLTTHAGMSTLSRAGRIAAAGKSIQYVRMLDDFPSYELNNVWTDIASPPDVVYVVQTSTRLSQRCILMVTDPGDIVLDPTCGSGTTAAVAEQWGRRWITIDTSRVALALARARIMGARYPFYVLADSRVGQLTEGAITRSMPSTAVVHGDIRQGFVYERVPHITLKSIANDAEINVIWEQWQTKLEPLRVTLNTILKTAWQEWEVPRAAEAGWPAAATKAHEAWLQARIERQHEIDASIAAKAEFEYLYDKPYEDKKTVRVAGPFTVESLSPHRVLMIDENDDVVDPLDADPRGQNAEQAFAQMILESLKSAGVQQAHKDDKIVFTALTPWPGDMVCADGRYIEGDSDSGTERRAAIFIGPEFGTVTRPDLVQAAREAADAGFDVLITCAFSYEAYATEFDHLGSLRVLKARMNADLHMADDLKNTGKGNLFVIFGEPDIELIPEPDEKIRVKINGVDVFHPNTGEVRSDGPDGIACWFIDTDYNEESFFVRHAYFLGANDPYGSLKTTLKAEIDADAWASLNSDISRPFPKPKSGRIAVKVINHLGDEVMKVFRVDK